ncbi:hypothetical protein DFH11DRAFT_1165978 [Phellopilus nigrolimitatus]|nr:hypothetical protein DFH11DRAFT_1165978 [Phellopilus nigrolimitatus]
MQCYGGTLIKTCFYLHVSSSQRFITMSNSEPTATRSVLVVFTKRDSNGVRKMGILVKGDNNLESRFILAGNWDFRGNLQRATSMPVSIEPCSTLPGYFVVERAFKLHVKPLSDEEFKAVRKSMFTALPANINESLEFFLGLFLTKVNLILCDEYRSMDKEKLARSMLEFIYNSSGQKVFMLSPSLFPILNMPVGMPHPEWKISTEPFPEDPKPHQCINM